jgi:hypothetical protein
MTKIESISAERLERAFVAISSVLPRTFPQAARQTYSFEGLTKALINLKEPLECAKRNGGLVNPWVLAGLKRDEVRNVAALAGLWQTAFGGTVSQRFLTKYLQAAIEGIAWDDELHSGYQISTETSPIGDRADRVDVILETASFVIGIEVKIDASLGREQLERYLASIDRRAKLRKARAYVVLLAPFRSPIAGVTSTSWRDVAGAARLASGRTDRAFIHQYIAAFGDHVSSF